MRAYVTFAPGISRDRSLVAGITWAARASAELPTLWLPGREMLLELPLAARLVRQGLPLLVDEPTGRRERPTPPAGRAVVAYGPTLERLVELEPISAPLVLVGAYAAAFDPRSARDGLAFHQPWIDAFAPEHVDGPQIVRHRPFARRPVLAGAMKTFTEVTHAGAALTTSLTLDDAAGSLVTDGLLQLRRRGHQLDPDEFLAAALADGWDGIPSLALRETVREIAAGKTIHPASRLDPATVRGWHSAHALPLAE